jgi:hypothetical protein
MTDTKKCIYCKNEFTPPKPTTTMCQFCWYGGVHHEAERKKLMAKLRAVKGVTSAEIHHTGGGCFGLAVSLADGRFLFATDAHKDEKTGEWFGEASLPDPGEPWALGIYRNEEVFGNCEDECADAPMRLPLTNVEFVAAVRDLVKTGGTK